VEGLRVSAAARANPTVRDAVEPPAAFSNYFIAPRTVRMQGVMALVPRPEDLPRQVAGCHEIAARAGGAHEAPRALGPPSFAQFQTAHALVIEPEAALPRIRGQARTSALPLHLIDRPVALISPPRRHRHRYFGVLVPNSSQGLRGDRAGRSAGRNACSPGTGAGAAASPPAPASASAETAQEPQEPIHRRAARPLLSWS
jgi:hypothetical protein